MKNKNLSGGLFAARPKPLTIRETPLSAQVKEYLDNRGLWNERLNCGKIKTEAGRWIQLCEKGTPDRIAIVRGRAIFIETKMFGKKPTAEQLDKHEQLRRAGAIVIVADDYADFTAKFSAVRARLEEEHARKGVSFYD